MYRRARELVAQTCRDKEIIYAPTCVLLSRMKTIAPPGIRPGKVGIKEPERIGKTAFEQQGELAAFLVGKTGIASVCRRILQIYLVVRHVHVAANHYGLGLRKLEQVFAEGVVPRHAVVEPRQTVLRVGSIYVYKIKRLGFQRDNPPFAVVFAYSQSVAYRKRFAAREYRRARISFLLSIVPVRLISVESYIYLAVLQFGFLQAEKIGVQLRKGVLESFSHTSP